MSFIVPSPCRRTFLKSSGVIGAAVVGSQPLARVSEVFGAQGDQEGWVSLFDGKTLNGWHKNPQKIGHGTGGSWQVEDGAIAGEQDPPGSGNGGILLTDQKFGDFELSIDMKPDWGVCSGLFIRGNDKGQCFQMMVDYHDQGNIGHIYGEGTGAFNTRAFSINGKLDDNKQLVGFVGVDKKPQSAHGSVYTCSAEDWIKAWKIDQWNNARVRVDGKYPRITTWINGTKINEFDGANHQSGQYDKDKVYESLGREGSVAVQVHGGTGWPNGAKCRWKNIKVKLLS